MPKISIVIPVYKVEKTLKRCVDSVISQSFSDFEVILVNDGSPDRCGDICDDYVKRYDFVSVIHQENAGLSSARNAGLQRACGEYVMFLDSDDYLDTDCLTHVYRNDSDLIIGSIINEYDDGTQMFQPERRDERFISEQFPGLISELFKERRLNYVHAKLYRRQVILDYGLLFEDDMLTSAEDTVFNFAFLKHCRSIYISGKHVHHYLLSSGGLGSRFYIDRYVRFKRLNDYVEDTCRKMGWLNDELQTELDYRLVRGAVWSLAGIDKHTEISLRTRRKALDYMCDDDHLRKIVPTVKIEHKEDLTALMQKGSKSYLLHKSIKRAYANLIHPDEIDLYTKLYSDYSDDLFW